MRRPRIQPPRDQHDEGHTPSPDDPQGYWRTEVWCDAGSRKVKISKQSPDGLAVGGERVALLRKPFVRIHEKCDPRVTNRIDVGGRARAIALSRTQLAVLTSTGAGRAAIELYDPAGGRRQGRTVEIPTPTEDAFSISERRLVFRTGNIIQLLDTRTGRSPGS
jgi:hypothetical protein